MQFFEARFFGIFKIKQYVEFTLTFFCTLKDNYKIKTVDV